MRTLIRICLACTLLGGFTATATAGPQGDELARCLVQSTSEDDKAVLAQWLFSSMALHPKVSQLASVPEERRTQATKDLAALIQKIFTRTCREEARVAYKAEGDDAIANAFGVFGKVALESLLTEPKISENMNSFLEYLDKAELQKALTE
jgi:hypothetical protein